MCYELRWAKPEEWPAIMNMVWNTFIRFDGQDCTKEGRQSFYDFITDPNLFQAFVDGKYQVLVALDEGKIVGVGSLRNINHLSLLFVDEDYQLMGIGRSLMEGLCDYLKNEVGERYMSLAAAPYAVDFYKKLGFTQVKPLTNYSGVKVTAMEKIF